MADPEAGVDDNVLFSLGGWNVTDWLKQAVVIEPVYPFECSHLDSLQVTLRQVDESVQPCTNR